MNTDISSPSSYVLSGGVSHENKPLPVITPLPVNTPTYDTDTRTCNVGQSTMNNMANQSGGHASLHTPQQQQQQQQQQQLISNAASTQSNLSTNAALGYLSRHPTSARATNSTNSQAHYLDIPSYADLSSQPKHPTSGGSCEG